MDTTFARGRIVLRPSTNNGAASRASVYLTEDANYHTAPMPVNPTRGRALAWNMRLIPSPRGARKFTIRYHRKSRKYWTLCNPALADCALSAKARVHSARRWC